MASVPVQSKNSFSGYCSVSSRFPAMAFYDAQGDSQGTAHLQQRVVGIGAMLQGGTSQPSKHNVSTKWTYPSKHFLKHCSCSSVKDAPLVAPLGKTTPFCMIKMYINFEAVP